MPHVPTSPPVALATWMSQRLLDTLAAPLDAARTYALTIVDPAGFDPDAMLVRAVVLDDGERLGSLRPDERPDAFAAASRLWSAPAVERAEQPLRPSSFAVRRAALAVGVVCEEGIGAVIRYEHDPDRIEVADARRAAGSAAAGRAALAGARPAPARSRRGLSQPRWTRRRSTSCTRSQCSSEAARS